MYRWHLFLPKPHRSQRQAIESSVKVSNVISLILLLAAFSSWRVTLRLIPLLWRNLTSFSSSSNSFVFYDTEGKLHASVRPCIYLSSLLISGPPSRIQQVLSRCLGIYCISRGTSISEPCLYLPVLDRLQGAYSRILLVPTSCSFVVPDHIPVQSGGLRCLKSYL